MFFSFLFEKIFYRGLIVVDMSRFTSGFLSPPSSKPPTPASTKGKEKESPLLETKKRKALELASGSSSKKVGCMTRANAAMFASTDEPTEIDPTIFTALLEHLSLPLIYLNETVTLSSWSQICEYIGLEAMRSAFSMNILVSRLHYLLFTCFDV